MLRRDRPYVVKNPRAESCAIQRTSACFRADYSNELIHSSALEYVFCGQRESRVTLSAVQHAARYIFPDSRSVLETGTGATAYEPNIVHLRVTIDQEIAARSIFVLADARLHDRCGVQGRKSARHMRPNLFNSL